MRPFELFIGAEVSRKMIGLPDDEPWQALAAFETLANHPFTTGLPHWLGEDGRTRYLREIRGWMITFTVDHADRAVRVLDVERP